MEPGYFSPAALDKTEHIRKPGTWYGFTPGMLLCYLRSKRWTEKNCLASAWTTLAPRHHGPQPCSGLLTPGVKAVRVYAVFLFALLRLTSQNCVDNGKLH